MSATAGVPMPGACPLSAVSSVLPVVVLGVALLGGCATSVDVRFDEDRDFARYRSWDWRARQSRIAGGAPEQRRHLDALAARLVREALLDQGLVRARRGADLLLSYDLEVHAVRVAVSETGAEQLVSSLHASPSYYVQATRQRIEVHHVVRLRIALRDRREARVVWRGELRTRRKGDFASHLPGLVERLLDRLPRVDPTRRSVRVRPPAPSSA